MYTVFGIKYISQTQKGGVFMDVLFVTPTDKPGLSHEVNGTMLLATKLLQEGYDTDILRFYQSEAFGVNYSAFIGHITAQILEKDPRCVSVYTLWPSFHVMLRIAHSIKAAAPHIPIVMGGPLVSLMAEELMTAIPWVDYVCCGEGENTIVPFIRALLGDRRFDSVPGLYYRSGSSVSRGPQSIPLCDLDTIPPWDNRLLRADPRAEEDIGSPYYYMPIDVGRGCPYNCSFCCTSRFWLHNYRLKSPEKILDEIRHYHDNFGIRSFLFSHDAFTSNKKLVADVCDRIIASDLRISWSCTTRADCVNEALVLKMKESGLTQLQLGVETGSARMQKLIHKNLDLNTVQNLVAFLLKEKIALSLFFMYGFPEETEEDLKDTLNLVFTFLDMGVQNVSMSYCNFSPATQITNEQFDKLVFDPDAVIASNKIFGFAEEIPMIREHKELFPFFYHLNTPLRDEFMHINQLVGAYRRIPGIGQILRQLYNRDDLQLYRDFVQNNANHFARQTYSAETDALQLSYTLLRNTAKGLQHPRLPQITALFEFLYDVRKIAASGEDRALRKAYAFSYLDYTRKKPLEQYSDGQSEILIEKVAGKTKFRILDIR